MTGLRADIINNCLKQNGGKKYDQTVHHVHVTPPNLITKVDQSKMVGKDIPYKY